MMVEMIKVKEHEWKGKKKKKELIAELWETILTGELIYPED